MQAYLTGRLYSPPASERLCRGVFLALGGVAGENLEFPKFVQWSSQLLRGSLSQRSQRLHVLCSGDLDLMRETLQVLLTRLCHSETSSSSSSASWAPSSPHSLASLVKFLMKSVGVAGGRSLSVEEIESWVASSPAVGRILDVAFGTSFYHRTLRSSQPPPEVVSLVGLPVREDEGAGLKGGWDTQRVLVPLHIPHPGQRGHASSSLLSSAALLMINTFLPLEVRGQLYPLFQSGQHGQSFSTLCKSLVGSGPCLLVIRDSGGHIFGGFAAISWQFGPQFIGEGERSPVLASVPSLAGNSECFLFSLHPAMAVFTATGYNDHFMYLQQNAQTMPNGLVSLSLSLSPSSNLSLSRQSTGHGRAAGVLWTVAEC